MRALRIEDLEIDIEVNIINKVTNSVQTFCSYKLQLQIIVTDETLK